MKYRDWNEKLYKQKAGKKVWACAYDFDSNKETMGYISKPIYGILSDRHIRNDISEINTDERALYFIPFRKGSDTTLAKSKQVSIYARVYADTYEECVELYNELIQEKIDWFQNKIKKIEEDFIK